MRRATAGVGWLVVLGLVASVGLAAAAGPVQAAAESGAAARYPSKAIVLIVPWAAGGDTDVLYRIVAEFAEKELGQPVVVQNIPGGGGTVGAAEALRRAPDGYTWFAGHDSLALSYLTGVVDFSYFDFQPVALMTSTPEIWTARANFPARDAREALELVRRNPGRYTFAATLGSTSHMFPLAMQVRGGLQFRIVSYEGTAERTQAAVGGHVDFISSNIASGKSYVDAGRLKFLAIATAQRDPRLPDLPTLKELGVDWEQAVNRGIYVPKGTDPAIVRKIADALGRVASNPQFRARIEGLGTQVNYIPLERYEAFLRKSLADLTEMTRAMGVYARG
ncbi:MAG TPA: tripartite tricarboxylate transporter substrate binding protein [Limnochordales bacterium]